MPSEKIPPPDDLDEASKKLWRAKRKQLQEQNTWEDSDAETLELYVRALQRAREGREAAAPEPYVAGSKDQLVAHPGLTVARNSERDAHLYATDLLLTPAARARHEIEKAKAANGGKFGDI